jgi:hypothetical protein
MLRAFKPESQRQREKSSPQPRRLSRPRHEPSGAGILCSHNVTIATRAAIGVAYDGADFTVPCAAPGGGAGETRRW